MPMKLFTLALLISLIAAPVRAQTTESRAFPEGPSAAQIAAKYEAAGAGGEKVKILLMPGHEPGFGGTELGALKERDIAVEIANDLAAHLKTDPRLEVFIARDTTAWAPELSEYFEEEWTDIERFVRSARRAMNLLIKKETIEERTFEVGHNTAATDVALRLYGINKWANENEYDLAIHIHLNDNPGATNHSGFAVYIPDSQYGNSESSKALGTEIANELNQFNASSTLPIENYAIVEDQSLIALGSRGTANFASVLIEYGYIYENKISNASARPAVLDDFAYQTYRGIRDFLGTPVAGDNSLALPHAWETGELKVGTAGPQVYALQAALKKLAFYPPKEQLLIGCPISGYAGECTISALKAFQAAKGLEQTGSIGPRTKAALQAAGY
jgi:N-acetylmuramoyl-L-alanine amidase